MYFRLLCLLIAMISHSSFGQWYESQGMAVIQNNDEKAAKAQATQNALKKALLVAGASVSSVQQVVNGLLTQDEFNIRATGSVNSLELISENYTDNTVTVTVRVDILPQEQKCFAADYRKSMLLTRSNLLHREQANIGSIYKLDHVLIQRLANKIKQQGIYLDTKLAIKSKTEFSRLNQSLQADDVKALAKTLTQLTDTQFVLFSEIDDISLANNENNSWQFWQNDIFQRQFNITFYIYDGITGEQILEKQYHTSAPWEFTPREHIEVNSNNFWQSAYGQQIAMTLDNVVTDIDENMMCQPTQGKIVQVSGNQIIFNLGKRQGVQIGDEFSLLHFSNFTSDNNRSYSGYNISPYKVIVDNVTNDSARATVTDQHILNNIQINDLAVRY